MVIKKDELLTLDIDNSNLLDRVITEYYGEVANGKPHGWGSKTVIYESFGDSTNAFTGQWVDGNMVGIFKCDCDMGRYIATYYEVYNYNGTKICNLDIDEQASDKLANLFDTINSLRKDMQNAITHGVSTNPISISDSCPRCNNNPRQVVLSCGHSFCGYCVSKEQMSDRKCHICGKQVMFHVNLADRDDEG